jgi:hypothetical protein
MGQLLRQSQRYLTLLPRLVWIPQYPQDPGGIRVARYSWILDGTRAGLLRDVQSDSLVEVLAGLRQGTKVKQRCSERQMNLLETSRITGMLGQEEAALPKLPRRLQGRTPKIKRHQSHQHLEQARGFSHVMAQLTGPGVGVFYLWGRITFGGHPRSAQG